MNKLGYLVIGMLFVLACQIVSKDLFDGVRTGREGRTTGIGVVQRSREQPHRTNHRGMDLVG